MMKKGRKMALYEHVFLSRQDISPQQVDELVASYKGIVEAQGGSVGRIENWGLRSLTYRIKKNRKAYYTLMDITAPAAAIAELERQQGISEDVLRFFTVKVDAHETGPSAMLQKRERDDDRERMGSFDRPRRDRPAGDRPFGDRPPRRDRDETAAAGE
jgi:small subunit ribosomal protein S6